MIPRDTPPTVFELRVIRAARDWARIHRAWQTKPATHPETEPRTSRVQVQEAEKALLAAVDLLEAK